MAGPSAAAATVVATENDAKAGTAPANDDSTRGRPYYEKLRRDLKQTLEEKRKLDLITLQTEERIQKLEMAYLEETSAAGNIVKGFDNYSKASASSTITGSSVGGGTATRRKGGISEQDKIFSRSSVSWTPEQPTNLIISNGASNSNGTSHTGTPSGRDTPVSATGPGHKGTKGNKRKKHVEPEDSEENTKSTKRGKITWGRD